MTWIPTLSSDNIPYRHHHTRAPYSIHTTQNTHRGHVVQFLTICVVSMKVWVVWARADHHHRQTPVTIHASPFIPYMWSQQRVAIVSAIRRVPHNSRRLFHRTKSPREESSNIKMLQWTSEWIGRLDLSAIQIEMNDVSNYFSLRRNRTVCVRPIWMACRKRKTLCARQY